MRGDNDPGFQEHVLRILITGARAPIATDLAHALVKSGHKVWVADSFWLPIGRFYPKIEGYVRLPAPALDFSGFSTKLIHTQQARSIELIIPTSEEVFWLAQIPEIRPYLFAPCFDQLAVLHHKYHFAVWMQSLGYGAPENVLISSRVEAEEFLKKHDSRHYVFKPVYSRFGCHVKIAPAPDAVLGLNFQNPWLAQTKIVGDECCIYTIVQNGRLCYQVAYRPKYRIGNGASIYFEPVIDARLQEFVHALVGSSGLTGQLSFDVMLTTNGLVALECNPRGTSGIHLAAQHPEALALAFTEAQTMQTKDELRPAMLSLPLLIHHGWRLGCADVRKDYTRAYDALHQAGVPFWATMLATAELLGRALWARESPLILSTRDIEWNGNING
jgi:hypothetical protein